VARKKTPKLRLNIKAALSRRLREIRQELFGDHGGPELARLLNLPARTWYNYETGVTVPAEVLLDFIDHTGVNPEWLITGEGSRYRRDSDEITLAELSPIELIRRGLEKIEQQPNHVALVAPEGPSGEVLSEYLAVGIVALQDLARRSVDPLPVDGYVLAFRNWLPHPSETVAIRLDDDAMAPVLPAGSVVAIDRSVSDPRRLHGRMVAACPEGEPLIRWLDLSGRHLILRPNVPSEQYPLIPVELDELAIRAILGQVVWSWSCFSQP
jgi:hypothetical protein